MTDIWGKIRRPSGTWPMPRATMSWGGVCSMACPAKWIVPLRGRFNPEIVRNVVVLPAPFAPSNATISPSSTFRLTPRSARIVP